MMLAVHLFVRLSVCSSVCRQKCIHKYAEFSETKQYGAMVSIDEDSKSYMGFSKIPFLDS